ncbi:MAG: peptidylprolyl isomerase [Thermoleophilia bacterium]
MIKKLVVVAALVSLAAAAFGCGGGDLPKDAAAKVGETVITKADLDTRVSEIQTQMPGKTPDPKEKPEEFKEFQAQVLDYMITLAVLNQKSTELGVTITDADVQTQLDSVKQMFGGDDAKFQDALKQQNMTLEQLLQNLRERELLSKSAEAATKDITVSDADISAYYEEHKAEFQQAETRTARHILFSPGDGSDVQGEHTDAEWEAARAEAEAARKRLQSGEDFATLARELSEDAGSKEQGGDLGEVSKGVMVPAFEESVFSLKVGELSQPVKTQFGYHLIEVESLNEAKQLTLDEVKEQIKAQLLDEAQKAAWKVWLDEAKTALKVVIGEDYVTTTTLAGGTSSTVGGDTTTTAAGETTTTAAGETTTTKQ